MFRLRGNSPSIRARMITLIEGEGQADSSQMTAALEIVWALGARESAGETTSLRQLHKVAQLGQAEALNVVSQMERDGLVSIGSNINDAFEAEVSLDDELLKALERQNSKRVA